ncbi:unnamed protein product, partial [marine sediment metagenome]
MPYGLIPVGVDWDDPGHAPPAGSPFLTPWAPTPNRTGSLSSPAGAFKQFYEPWDSIDTSIWTYDFEMFPAWKTSYGFLRSDWSGAVMGTVIYHDIAETLPVNLNLQLRVVSVSGTHS